MHMQQAQQFPQTQQFQPVPQKSGSTNYILIFLLMVTSAVIAALVTYIVVNKDDDKKEDDEKEVVVEDDDKEEIIDDEEDERDDEPIPGDTVVAMARKSIYLPTGWEKLDEFSYDLITGLEDYPLGGCYDAQGGLADCEVIIIRNEDDAAESYVYDINISSPGYFTQAFSFVPMGSRYEMIEVDGTEYSVEVVYQANGLYTAEDLEAMKPVTEEKLSDIPLGYHVCTADDICFAVNLMDMDDEEAKEQDLKVREFLKEVAIR